MKTMRLNFTPQAMQLCGLLILVAVAPARAHAADLGVQGVQEARDLIMRIRHKDQISTEEIGYLVKIMDKHNLETTLDAADFIEGRYIQSESYVDNFRNQYRRATTMNIGEREVRFGGIKFLSVMAISLFVLAFIAVQLRNRSRLTPSAPQPGNAAAEILQAHLPPQALPHEPPLPPDESRR